MLVRALTTRQLTMIGHFNETKVSRTSSVSTQPRKTIKMKQGMEDKDVPCTWVDCKRNDSISKPSDQLLSEDDICLFRKERGDRSSHLR